MRGLLIVIILCGIICMHNASAGVSASIPEPDKKRVESAAYFAEQAKVCGQDWETLYLQFMQKERRSKKWTNEQIAFIGGYFGMMQGAYSKKLEKQGCPSSLQKKIDKALQH